MLETTVQTTPLPEWLMLLSWATVVWLLELLVMHFGPIASLGGLSHSLREIGLLRFEPKGGAVSSIWPPVGIRARFACRGRPSYRKTTGALKALLLLLILRHCAERERGIRNKWVVILGGIWWSLELVPLPTISVPSQ